MPKIAVVGCGGMGRHHAGVITKKLGHKIAAACDGFPVAQVLKNVRVTRRQSEGK